MVSVQPVEVFCPVDAEQLLQGVNMVMKPKVVANTPHLILPCPTQS
jgi:hypothetical protein